MSSCSVSEIKREGIPDRIENAPPVPTQKDLNEKKRLERALECIQKSYDLCSDRPVVFSKIADMMSRFDSSKALDLFRQAFTCSMSSGNSNSVSRDLAKVIHLVSKNFLEEAEKMVGTLKNDYFGQQTIISYLERYKGSPLEKRCIEIFKGWGERNEYRMVEFARIHSESDFNCFLETLEKIKDVEISANEIVKAAQSKKHQIDDEVIKAYLTRIDEKVELKPYNEDLLLIKFKLSLLRGIKAQEVGSYWIPRLKSMDNGSPGSKMNRVQEALAHYLKTDNLQRALDVALMCDFPENVLKEILTSITPKQLKLVTPYIDKIEREQDQVKIWLSIASNWVTDYPEATKSLLPELVKKIESCPDGKEFGDGQRYYNSYTSYLDLNTSLMRSLVQIYINVGEIEEAEKLKNHQILQREKSQSHFYHTLMMADYYSTRKPDLAEEHYNKAMNMSKEINFGYQSDDSIRETIAMGMVHLNPDRALAMALEIREPSDRNRLLLKFIKMTAKSNSEFASNCVEKMSDGKYEVANKARGYLKLKMS